jgi:hypothetical protein
VVGNPVDGIAFYGPITDIEEANPIIERHFNNDEWWLAELQDLQELEHPTYEVIYHKETT